MKSKIPAAKSPHEEAFAIAWKALGGPPFEREYEFAKPRMWRFDFAWPEARIAVEIEGGVHDGWTRGRHMRQTGFQNDCEKYANGALMGWRIIRLTPAMIEFPLVSRILLEVRRSAP